MVLHKNKDGLNPLLLALQRGSQSTNDPINVVKLMLDSAVGSKLIEQTDCLGNLPLHFAAKSDSVPLSLSIIY